ncbi:uncharacterized protein LOC110460838 [Mizuhopecten yessoensis]|uniref:Uncharacterized protein n=1 Tax=Mizuhopecten yessoensis TaxID=6573 RepID=A0A210Q1P7_MIZYE|nr:uncharacterized protein LOC110460838 [Mizuhopecten yessoensis]OWF42609.1 hypothetical protein KP79_PYT10217 [Mizuhopecten yessoensis]
MAQDISNRWILLIVLFIALVLAAAGFGTPNWYRGVVLNTVSFTAGFFDVCVSSTCYNYIDYLKLTRYSDDYVGCIVFHVFGLVLAAAAVLLVLCEVFNCEDDCGGLNCHSMRRRFMYVAWLCLLGGICLMVTVIWFYVAVIRDGNGKGNLAGTFDLQADYSLGLTAAASAILIIISLFIFFLKRHFTDEEEPYKQRPRMMLEPVYRPPSPEPLRTMSYERPVHSRSIAAAPQTYRIEQPAPRYEVVDRPAPVRLSTSIRPPSPTYVSAPKTYRYSTAEEPAYVPRATYAERRY